MATIGNLFVKVGADVQPMLKSLAEAQGRIAQWSKSIAATATGAAGMVASVLPGEMGAMASRIMSGIQGIGNAASGVSGLVTSLGSSIGLLANPIGIAVVAATALVAAGAAVGAVIIGMTMKAAKLGDQLKETADELGTTAEGFQRLEYIGTAAGAGPEKIRASITKMQMAIANAGAGSKESLDSFKRLGVDLQKLGNMDPSAAFETLIGKIRELPSHTEKVKALRDIFGKGGTGLAGLVKLSADEMAALSAEAEAFTIKEGSVQALASLQDSIDTLGLGFERIMTEAFAPFAPMLQVVTDGLKNLFAQSSGSFFREMENLAGVMAMLLDALMPTLYNLMGLWNVLQGISGLLRTVMIGSLVKILELLLGIIEVINYIPGVEIPTGALERSIKELQRIRDEAASGALEDFAESGQRFGQAFEAGMANMQGTGQFTSALDEFKKQRDELAKTPPATGGGFTIVDPEAMKKAEELKQILEKLQTEADNIGKTEADLLRDQLGKLGATAEQIEKAIALQEKAIEGKEAAKSREAVAKQLEDLARKSDELRLSETDLLAAQLQRQNATADQIAEAQRLTDEITRLETAKRNATDVTKRIDDLKRKFEELQMSEDEFLAKSLEQLGATSDQIAEAIQLSADIDAMETAKKNAEDVQRILTDVARGVAEVGKSEAELMRQRLEQLGATADQIDQALAGLRDKEVGSMLADLEEQARKASMSEKELLADRLRAAGATEQELQRAMALQDQIDKAKGREAKTAAAVDSIDTALGSIKIPGIVDAAAVAERQLDQQVQQTQYLAQIAQASAAPSVEQASASQGGMATTDNALEQQQLQVLQLIEANTRGFAGVLT